MSKASSRLARVFVIVQALEPHICAAQRDFVEYVPSICASEQIVFLFFTGSIARSANLPVFSLLRGQLKSLVQ